MIDSAEQFAAGSQHVVSCSPFTQTVHLEPRPDL